MASRVKTLSIRDFIGDAEYGAGVLLFERGRVAATLTTDWLPEGFQGFRLGGVGGWCEPGETPWETAVREAREEVCCEIELLHAERSWLVLAAAPPSAIQAVERPAPFGVTRYRNALGPGDVYGTVFLARARGPLRPGDDVAGLLLIPPAAWPQRETTVGELVEAGAELRGVVPPDSRVWAHPDDSTGALVELLSYFG